MISGVSTKKNYFLIKTQFEFQCLKDNPSLVCVTDRKLTLDRRLPRGGESFEDADRRDRRRWDRDRDRLFETSLELVI